MLSLKIFKSFTTQRGHTPICIIGGGTGGISILGHLSRQKGFLPHQVKVFEPSALHHYQPGWTMVAGGLCKEEKFVTETGNMIHNSAVWERSRVVKVEPLLNKIITENGKEHTYDQLIIATGIRNDYNKIEGIFLYNFKGI